MHLCEGRPLVIMISGIVILHWLDEDKKLKYGKNILEHVINNLRKEHKLKFKDKTGCIFEIKHRLVSICSESYIVLSQSYYNKISFNFITLDLLYPFYRPEILEKDMQETKEFVIRLLKGSLPDDIKNLCEIHLISLRYMDSPYSLDILPFIPDR